MISNTLRCECNPNKLYSSKSTYNKHFASKRHRDWEAGDELRQLKIQLTQAQNEILSMRTEINRLTDLLMNPQKRKVSPSMKKKVASDAGWCCAVCCCTVDNKYEIDHVVPLAHGGSNDLCNLQLLCQGCHRKKTRDEFG